MLRVRTTFTGSTGSPWLSTAYFLGSFPDPTQADADAAVAAVGAFWGAVDSRMNTAIQWTTDPSVAVMDLDGQQTGAFGTTSQSGTGASASDLLPQATQALLRLRTNVFSAGREIRGRWFIPGLTEAEATAGNVTAAAATVFNVAAAALIATAGAEWCVWSRTQTTAAAVVTANTWTQFAVLRSRRD